MNHKSKLSAIAVLLVASSQIVSAQLDTICSVNMEHAISQEVDIHGSDSNGLSYSSTEAEFAFIRPLSPGSMVMASVGYNRTQYDFKSDALWDDMESISSLLMYERGLNDRWSLLTIGFIQSAYENGADFGDSISWGLGVGGKYKRSDTLNYLFGIGYFSRLEDDALIIPLIGIEWQINDRLALNSMLGMELVYDITGDHRNMLSAGLDYNLTDFRLKKDSADETDRAIRPEGVGIYLGYTRQLSESLQFNVKATAVSEGKFETRENGHKISTVKTDAGVVGSVGFSYRF